MPSVQLGSSWLECAGAGAYARGAKGLPIGQPRLTAQTVAAGLLISPSSMIMHALLVNT